MSKLKKFVPLFYIIFLVTGFLYVRSVLKEGNLEVRNKPDEVSIETKPVRVTLRVEEDDTPTEYLSRLRNVDSVNDLLLDAHAKQGFKYEKVAYNYGTEIDFVNGKETPSGFKWKIFKDNEDITYGMDEYHLEDEEVYVLKLVKQ